MQFNEKLKELRTNKGVSQSELAESIYVSRSAVAKWENGLGLPSNESLRLLSDYFGVSADELCIDSPTEKVIVQKNQIISRSRKLLVIISTACAVAITAIIVLAVVLGLQLVAASRYKNDPIKFTWRYEARLYSGAEYNYEEGCWNVLRDELRPVISERDTPIATGEVVWEKYTMTTGEYFLKVVPSPRGHNGMSFGIEADCIGLKYNADVFDIFIGIPEQSAGGEINYVFNIKQPCQNEEILLYKLPRGGSITEDSVPTHKMIITAVLSSGETV